MSTSRATPRSGTSGWMHAGWRGAFYPRGLRPQDRLAFYAARFGSVEIDTSFYRLPARRSALAWSRSVPANFVFAVKASRRVTHVARLAAPDLELTAMLRSLEPLGERIGPILFQLPPRWPRNAARLAAFLPRLSRDFRYAFEFPDPSWWSAEVYEPLARYRAAFCIRDAGTGPSPMEITTDFVYARLGGPGPPSQGGYGARALDDWANRFSRWRAQGRAVYCYFGNHESCHGLRDAAGLARRLAPPARSASLPTGPERRSAHAHVA